MLAERGGQRVAHLGRDRLDRRRMVREEPVGAHVEHHVLGRAVDPGPDDALGQRFARRVDLHDPGVLRAARSRRRVRRRCRSGCEGSPWRACHRRTAVRPSRARPPPRPPLPRPLLPAPLPPLLAPPAPPPPSAAAIRTGSARRLPGRFGRAHRRQANGCRSISSPFVSVHRGEDHMALRVVGAGLGRTGTASLQLALQQLLDGRCYHMGETFGRPDDIPVWHAAVNGSSPDWDAFLADYVATVDWPACEFWSRAGRRQPRRSRAPLDPVERRRLVEERPRHDLHRSRRATSRPDAPPVFGAQIAMADGHVRQHVHVPAGRTRPTAKRGVRGAQRGGARRPSIPTASSSGNRATDGSRSRPRSESPVPDDPFPHVNSTAASGEMIGLDARRGSVRRGGGGRPGSAARPDRAGCRAGATRPAWGRRRSTRRARSRRCRWRR